MNVLFLSGEFPPMQGGVGDYTACLVAALERRGVACAVVTTADRGVPSSRNVLPAMPGWRLRDWPHLVRLVAARSPQLLHVQYQTAAFGMRPLINLVPFLAAASGLRAPVVTTFHDLRIPYLFPGAGPLRAWANRLLATRSRACVVSNDDDAAKLLRMRKPGRSAPCVALIPIGSNIAVDPPSDFDRAELRARRGVGPGQSLIAFFGLLNQEKGVDTFLAAVAGLPIDHLTRAILIGGTAGDSDVTNTPHRQRMIALAHQLGLDDRVAWTGWLPPRQVSAHLLAADVCVLPFRDGASLRHGSLLAALAHSLPVITTAPPSGRSVGAGEAQLRDEENCLMVRPDDPAAVRAAILRVLKSPDLRQHLSSGAAALATHLSWDAIAADTARLYERLL